MSCNASFRGKGRTPDQYYSLRGLLEYISGRKDLKISWI